MSRGRQVRVHLKDGPSIEGVLLRRRFGRTYVLELASVVADTESTVELEGRVRIPRENIAFFQELH